MLRMTGWCWDCRLSGNFGRFGDWLTLSELPGKPLRIDELPGKIIIRAVQGNMLA